MDTCDIHQEFDIILQDELQVLTFKWVSQKFSLSTAAAQRELAKYVDGKKDLTVLYSLTGVTQGGEVVVALVVGLEGVRVRAQELANLTALHVYAVLPPSSGEGECCPLGSIGSMVVVRDRIKGGGEHPRDPTLTTTQATLDLLSAARIKCDQVSLAASIPRTTPQAPSSAAPPAKTAITSKPTTPPTTTSTSATAASAAQQLHSVKPVKESVPVSAPTVPPASTGAPVTTSSPAAPAQQDLGKKSGGIPLGGSKGASNEKSRMASMFAKAPAQTKKKKSEPAAAAPEVKERRMDVCSDDDDEDEEMPVVLRGRHAGGDKEAQRGGSSRSRRAVMDDDEDDDDEGEQEQEERGEVAASASEVEVSPSPANASAEKQPRGSKKKAESGSDSMPRKRQRKQKDKEEVIMEDQENDRPQEAASKVSAIAAAFKGKASEAGPTSTVPLKRVERTKMDKRGVETTEVVYVDEEGNEHASPDSAPLRPKSQQPAAAASAAADTGSKPQPPLPAANTKPDAGPKPKSGGQATAKKGGAAQKGIASFFGRK